MPSTSGGKGSFSCLLETGADVPSLCMHVYMKISDSGKSSNRLSYGEALDAASPGAVPSQPLVLGQFLFFDLHSHSKIQIINSQDF